MTGRDEEQARVFSPSLKSIYKHKHAAQLVITIEYIPTKARFNGCLMQRI